MRYLEKIANKMNCGALYIVTKSEDYQPRGGDMFKMAMHSIDSLKRVSNLPITMLTNMPCDRTDINVVQIESLNTERDYTKDKTFYIQQTPYESTIFIDGDTEILEDPEPLFDTCYDLCMPHAPKLDYENKVWHGSWNTYSTGTFLYNKNQVTDLLFERDKERYRQAEMNPDARIGNNKNYLSNQVILNQTIRREIRRVGIVIKPLHPRWIGIPPIAHFVDNIAILHMKDLHEDKTNRRTRKLTDIAGSADGWTVGNNTVLGDLSLWAKIS
jgi:hypothetical protein